MKFNVDDMDGVNDMDIGQTRLNRQTIEKFCKLNDPKVSIPNMQPEVRLELLRQNGPCFRSAS